VVFNLFLKVVDIIVLNPFQTKIIGVLVIFDIREAPRLRPEGDEENWESKNVNP
jgi:hypothetical protein